MGTISDDEKHPFTLRCGLHVHVPWLNPLKNVREKPEPTLNSELFLALGLCCKAKWHIGVDDGIDISYIYTKKVNNNSWGNACNIRYSYC